MSNPTRPELRILGRAAYCRAHPRRAAVRSSLALAAALAVGLLAGAPLSAQQKSPEATAAVPSAAELMQALRSKPTRGVASEVTKEEAERRALIEKLKAKSTRGLSLPERQQLSQAVSNQPKVDMEVLFEFDSDKITPAAEPALRALGEALASTSSDFLVAGHTDAKGRPAYNQDLSQRRAAAIRDYLASTYKIPAERLMAVGYGREQLKNPDAPMAPENRRVQVVNMIER